MSDLVPGQTRAGRMKWRKKGKVQDSVARLLRAPPEGANPQDLVSGYPDCLRSQSHRRSTVVVGNYALWTDNGGTSPGQSNPLYTFVDPVSAPFAPNEGFMVEPPGTAPGSDPLIPSAFMSIVPKDDQQIGPRVSHRKGPRIRCEPEP